MPKDWRPALGGGAEPLYERLVVAIGNDIESGVLSSGSRLPAQRDLAFRLKVSVGTVTKAYLEAERRGLVRGHVGRGTFVGGYYTETDDEVSDDRPIDLSLNIIPHQAAARRFAEAFSRAGKRTDILENLAYAPPAGQEGQRRAAALWMYRICGLELDWSRVLVTTGAQHAMALTFGHLCKRNDKILCERETFYGIKSLADHAGYKLVGCEMDEEGLIPPALEKVAKTSGAKILYVMPTVQNPTARTMSNARRQEIAKVIKRQNLWVVEDDNYALFAPTERKLEPLSSLVPDRSFYITGVSKSIAPGLRLGFLGCPPGGHLEDLLKAVRATIFAPPGWGGLFFSQWIEDGSAFEIAESTRKEISRRADMAREIFGTPFLKIIKDAPHFWLPLPELEAERVAGRALRSGVSVTPPAAPMAPGIPISGLRICLGGAAGMQPLKIALQRIKDSMSFKDCTSSSAVV